MMNRAITSLLLLVTSFIGYGFFIVYAAPPSGGYNPADTLQPNCNPGDTDCFVNIISNTSSSYSAANGILLSSNTFRLGGTLDQDTTINQNGRNITFSQIASFRIGSTSGSNIFYQDGRVALGGGYANASGTFSVGIDAGLNASPFSGNNNFIGREAGKDAHVAFSNFIGYQAGTSVTPLNSGTLNFIGYQSGKNMYVGEYVNSIGAGAGLDSSQITYSDFIGSESGKLTSFVTNSVLLGRQSGFSGENISDSVFLGPFSGSGSRNITRSLFMGSFSGLQVENISDSIFIGDLTGCKVGVGCSTTSSSGSNNSILIGRLSATGGYSNTIGLGSYVTNTTNNQFMVATSITNFNFRGINYVFPASQGNPDTFLQNDGFGNLSWGTLTLPDLLIGSTLTEGTETILGTSVVNLGTPSFAETVFIGSNAGYSQTGLNDFATMIGALAGSDAFIATESVMIGYQAGLQMVDGVGNISIGSNAGARSYGFGSVNIGYFAGSDSVSASNALFIGTNSGVGDTVDNTTDPDDYSILIGNNTNTGGFSNSIAIGAYATNTATNQFMIGSTTRRIEEMVFNGGTGNTCSIIAGTGISCSSDERLKTNITDLSSTTLDDLMNIRTVTYNWNTGTNDREQIGFIAQNINDYFPQLVTTNYDGMLSVNYGGMTPVIVKAVQELNLKIDDFTTNTSETSLKMRLIEWFASIENGIQRIFTKELRTELLCVGQTCITETEFLELLQNQAVSSVSNADGSNEIGDNSSIVDDSLETIDQESSSESGSGNDNASDSVTPIPDSVSENNSSISTISESLVQE